MENAKQNKMGTAPIFPLIVSLSLPAMFSMLIDLAIGGALIGLGVLGYRVLHLNIHSVTIVVMVILAIVTWVMRNLLFTSGARMLSELEG